MGAVAVDAGEGAWARACVVVRAAVKNASMAAEDEASLPAPPMLMEIALASVGTKQQKRKEHSARDLA